MKTILITLSCLLLINTTVAITDKDLPHMNPYQAGQLYALMIKVDKIFKKTGIKYWAEGGTLLGAIRHKGLIPWDDDLDIAILADHIERLNEILPLLEENGLTCIRYEGGDGHPSFFKVFPIHRNKDLCPGKCTDANTCLFPCLDIFPMTFLDDTLVHFNRVERVRFKNDYFFYEDIAQLKEAPFGPMHIPIPDNAPAYLARIYGCDWHKVAYVYGHTEKQSKAPIKVPTFDWKQNIPYILPDDV